MNDVLVRPHAGVPMTPQRTWGITSVISVW